MKIFFKIVTLVLLFVQNAYGADEIEKGKELLKLLTKKSLTKEETSKFIKDYAITLEDERGDGEVTYVFDEKNYKRYKNLKIISEDSWRFSNLGALRLFNKDVKMTWRIKLSKDENFINIKTKFEPVGKLYKFEFDDKNTFLASVEAFEQAEQKKAKEEKERKKAEKLAEKKRLEEEKLAAEEEKKRLEEEKLAAEKKLEEEKKKLEEEKLALQKELEKQRIELEKQKKKAEEEKAEAKKDPKQKRKEEMERRKAERLAAKKKAKEDKERKKAEKLAEKKRLKEEKERKKAEELAAQEKAKEEELAAQEKAKEEEERKKAEKLAEKKRLEEEKLEAEEEKKRLAEESEIINYPSLVELIPFEVDAIEEKKLNDLKGNKIRVRKITINTYDDSSYTSLGRVRILYADGFRWLSLECVLKGDNATDYLAFSEGKIKTVQVVGTVKMYRRSFGMILDPCEWSR